MDGIKEGLLSPAERLGITPGTVVIAVDAPPDYPALIGRLPHKCVVVDRLEYNADYIHFFARDEKTLAKRFPDLKKHLCEEGIICVSFPAGRAACGSSLDADTVRDIGLASGLVDVKLTSLGDSWLAMKFIHRIKDPPVRAEKTEKTKDSGKRSRGFRPV